MTDNKKVKDGKVSDLPKFGQEDFNHIAEWVVDTLRSRERKRKHIESMWSEVDRQLRMEPSVRYKENVEGRDNNNNWMPEMELPNQAQALEVICADVRRMTFPDSGAFYRVHGRMTQELIEAYENYDFMQDDQVKFVREVTGSPAIDQGDINAVTQSFMDHIHTVNDFESSFDQITAQAVTYGNGVGRVKMANKTKFTRTEFGVAKEKFKIPFLVPRDIRNVYLDDNVNNVLHEGQYLGPCTIQKSYHAYEDLVMSANKGSKDVNEEDGGWMPSQLKGMQPGEGKLIEVIEVEGDIIVPNRGDGSMVLHNSIITVAVGAKDKQSEGRDKNLVRCIRYRRRQTELDSYVEFPYHVEDLKSPYATSPLMKGMPIQQAASEAMNRVLMAMALDTQPPVRYDRDDAQFAADGGPQLYPGSQMASIGDIQILDVGNPQSMLLAYQEFKSQHDDMTGVNAPRLGAQTLSHTTAYSKQQELSRGQIRTVDFVKTSLKGGLHKWLTLCYDMGRKALGENELQVFMNETKSFIDISSEVLPDVVHFEVNGAATPSENTAKVQSMLQSLQLAMQIDQLKVQMGMGEPLDYGEIQKEILKQGGVEDVERFAPATGQGNAATAQNPAGLQNAAGGAGGAGTAYAALQALSQGARE